jgi:NAD(P)-dependent dehydrogenase (short-subunit alcohol dehydrogenase family)
MGYRPFQADLSGRIALVTGANSGMGSEVSD